ncbi:MULTISPECIES: hypothetical protein [Pseudomonas]|jgi:hypothetical protein|nr:MULTISPECIES: hypothetical protein [Pseudomonas]MEA3169373.1 hypothetical protein [Pseudomonas sp.]WLH71643.1 hypothetical protein PSH70_16790 [Pseudomonas fluorescens]
MQCTHANGRRGLACAGAGTARRGGGWPTDIATLDRAHFLTQAHA